MLKYKDINEYVLAFDDLNEAIVKLESSYTLNIDTPLWLKPILTFLRDNVHATGEEILKELKSLNFNNSVT